MRILWQISRMLPAVSALCLGAAGASVACSQTAIFQNGAAAPFGGGGYSGAQDTMILTNTGPNQDSNFGGRDDFEVGTFLGSPSTARHVLLRFDLTSMAGQFNTITGVTLRLTFESPLAVTTSNTVEVHRVAPDNAGWVEGTGITTTVATGGVSTWDFRNQTNGGSGIPWAGSGGASTPGADFLSPILASAGWSGAPTPGTTYDLIFNDVSFLTDWVSGNNSGLFLKNASESVGGDNRAFFYSSDFSTVAFRPQLIVSYSAIPEPSCLAVLLAVSALGGRLVLGRVRRQAVVTQPAK
jgi:hypothetical protein